MNEFLLLGLIGIGVLIPGTFFGLKFFKNKLYTDSAEIFREDQNGHLLPIKTLKMRRINKKGVFYIEFYNRFIWNYKIQDKQYKCLTHNANRKYFFFDDGNRNYSHIEFIKDSIGGIYKMKVIPAEVFSTQQQILQTLNSDYDNKSFWEKHGPLLVGVSMVVLLIFAIMYQWHEMQIITDKNLQSARYCYEGYKMFFENGTAQNLTGFQVA